MPLNQFQPLHLPQPLGEQAAGHAGNTPVDVGKTLRATHELAKDQWRPAVGDGVGDHGDGAVLPVALHGTDFALPEARCHPYLQPMDTIMKLASKVAEAAAPHADRHD